MIAFFGHIKTTFNFLLAVTSVFPPKSFASDVGPNISGSIEPDGSSWSLGFSYLKFSGALKAMSSGDSGSNPRYDSGGYLGMQLDASMSSNAYGKSSTVQPKSLQLLPCIKF